MRLLVYIHAVCVPLIEHDGEDTEDTPVTTQMANVPAHAYLCFIYRGTVSEIKIGLYLQVAWRGVLSMLGVTGEVVKVPCQLVSVGKVVDQRLMQKCTCNSANAF